jgi:hypothetical protein
MGLDKKLSQLMDCPLPTNNTNIIISTKIAHSFRDVILELLFCYFQLLKVSSGHIKYITCSVLQKKKTDRLK